MVRDRFRAITALGRARSARLASDAGRQLARERQLLGAALQDVQAMIPTMAGFAMASESDASADLPRRAQHDAAALRVGDVVVAWLLLRQATVALAALDGDVSASDADFYRGKVAAAQWFCRQVLPHVSAERAVLEATDLDVMGLTDSSF